MATLATNLRHKTCMRHQHGNLTCSHPRWHWIANLLSHLIGINLNRLFRASCTKLIIRVIHSKGRAGRRRKRNSWLGDKKRGRKQRVISKKPKSASQHNFALKAVCHSDARVRVRKKKCDLKNLGLGWGINKPYCYRAQGKLFVSQTKLSTSLMSALQGIKDKSQEANTVPETWEALSCH